MKLCLEGYVGVSLVVAEMKGIHTRTERDGRACVVWESPILSLKDSWLRPLF